MSRTCEMCLKSSQKSATRSFSNIKTLRRQHINLQKNNGLWLCTRCIKLDSKKSRSIAKKAKVTRATHKMKVPAKVAA